MPLLALFFAALIASVLSVVTGHLSTAIVAAFAAFVIHRVTRKVERSA